MKKVLFSLMFATIMNFQALAIAQSSKVKTYTIKEGVNWEWTAVCVVEGSENRFECTQRNRSGATIDGVYNVSFQDNGKSVSMTKIQKNNGVKCTYNAVKVQGENLYRGTYSCDGVNIHNWSLEIN